jgi:hypothetical protein
VSHMRQISARVQIAGLDTAPGLGSAAMHAPFAHGAGAVQLVRSVTTLAAVAAFVAAPSPLDGQDRPTALARAESAYLQLRDLKDQIDVTAGRGVATSAHGLPLRELVRRYARARLRFAKAMTQVGQPSLSAEDRRALDVMSSTYGRELVASPLTAARRDTTVVSCDADSTSPAHETREALAQRLYKCFGAAARHVTVGDTVLDRLSILGLLSREPDADRRRTLLLALEPMWHTVVGNGGADNPYRRLIRLSAEQPDSERPDDLAARKLGLERAQLESWLGTSRLPHWSSPGTSITTPAQPVER